MKRLLKFFIAFSLLGTTVALVLGYLSFLHPLFDSMSHFRIHLLFIWCFLVLIVVFLQRHTVRYILIVLLIVVGGYITMLLQPYKGELQTTTDAKVIKFMQFNLNFRNRHMQRVKEYLEEQKIEIATFQEVTSKHRQFLEEMKEAYPFQRHCKFAGVGDVAILSKYPFVESQGGCVKEEGLVWARVQFGEGELSVASLHLHWPYPYKHHSQISRLEKAFAKIPSPKIIAGDFNAAPWSYAVKRVMKASDTKVVEGIRWSLNIGDPSSFVHMQIPIDHILLSKEFGLKDIHVGKSLGSDHFPIISEIVFQKKR
ncbi:endonuclease/exonuclease/phosphatase family protein [Sulfurovum sp. zt1-1]|uniref:Endonuclease/exonuclease/phosphatase family protein n=1 Tax=Sulfurovum zhangzhouensis TaxID=3019067 RepID=A0ABT7QZR4_9BACT|nr:endonuclease/exonuclease/phosphatase family protein [Sulfurovum zhangzhouensis]MDM5272329.1 endonuclease/exonuclease/phosphatase family protein [Sulfurovum zhangzhouensis]